MLAPISITRFGMNWQLHRFELSDLLEEYGIPKGSRVIDVGGHSGDEVADLQYQVTCIDPCVESLKQGSQNYPWITFREGIADALPVKTADFDAYISLRTWCVAGVLPCEAFLEAIRVVRSTGLIVASFPIRYNWICGKRVLPKVSSDGLIQIALETFEMMKALCGKVETMLAPEDFVLVARNSCYAACHARDAYA